MSGFRRSKRNATLNGNQNKRKRVYVDASTTESDSDDETFTQRKKRSPRGAVPKIEEDSPEASPESEEDVDANDSSSSDSEVTVAKNEKKSLRSAVSANKKAKRKMNVKSNATASSTSEESEIEETKSKRSKRRKSRSAKTKTVIEKIQKLKKNKGRKEIKKIIDDEDLQDQTREAEKEERERLKRLKEKEKIDGLDDSVENEKASETMQVVLQKDPFVQVSPYIASRLRPHQVEGIRFMWDNLVESTDRATNCNGAGCILAHCMGLGKTLQTIAVIHTMLKCKHLSFTKALIVAPLNTVRNWIAEFVQWCEDGDELLLYNFAENKTNKARITMLKCWHAKGGVLILGYDMYRIMTTKIVYGQWKKVVAETLVNPGPDIVVCDEGHMLKNAGSHTSKQLNEVKSRRRLVLTGTPLQNNLLEYHCMVDFVKPDLLGSLKEFRNRFVNPITNGQHIDSTDRDVKIMKMRSHVLHQMLEGFVQRKDYSCLKSYLSSKFEYVLKVRLTPLQIKLYRHYLDTMTNRGVNNDSVNAHGKGTSLFVDYHNLMRVWTHPKSLLIHTEQQEKILRRKEENDFITDGDDTGSETDEWTGSDDEKKEQEGDEQEVKCLTSKRNDDSVIILSDTTDTDEEVIRKKSLKKDKRKKPTVKVSSDDSSCHDSKSDGGKTDSKSSSSSESEEAEKLPNLRSRTKLANKQKRYRLRRVEEDDDDESDEYTQLEDSLPKEEAWYDKILQEDPKSTENYENSLKLAILFEILRMAEERKEKVLVFSQSLISLDIIEEMLIHAPPPNGEVLTNHDDDDGDDENSSDSKPRCRWFKNIDYFRMDGATQGHHRQKWINAFNDENDTRSRLFLISTKAGGLGVNLVGANRVVIFDASWNPSHDTQSMFRVYRFGQTRKCYIYRLIGDGTMEEKIYQRQVNKQSLAFRVVDEQQINRHFTASSLAEMYAFEPSTLDATKPEQLPIVPKDEVLAEILSDPRTRHMIASYHEHDSLLDHQVGEELTEEERKAAWEEYEAAKAGRYMYPNPTYTNYSPSTIAPEMFTSNVMSSGPSGRTDFTDGQVYDSKKMTEMRLHLDRLSKLAEKAYFQYQSCEVKSANSILSHLKQTPLYRTADNQTVSAIAKEVNLRLRRQKEEKLRIFQKLNVQFKRVQDTYFSIVASNVTIAANNLSRGGAYKVPFHMPSRSELLGQLTSTATSSALSLNENSSLPNQTSTTISEVVVEITEDNEKSGVS